MNDVPLDPMLAPAARPPRIQDMAEVRRWVAEGRTLTWICEEYERRYNITTEPAMWGRLRRLIRAGGNAVLLTPLVPWRIDPHHAGAYTLRMLRTEERRRAGLPVSERDAARLATWTQNLAEGDLVIDYEPTTEEGFRYVPRRPGVDLDLVRRPGPDRRPDEARGDR